jgi:predicted nucleotidyltransferase
MKASDVRRYSFEEICDIVGSVAAEYGVEKVYLFGSRARGDGHEGSDYDFL